MPDSTLLLLTICLILVLLLATMLVLMHRSNSRTVDHLAVLLRDQRIENQKLRNLILAPSVHELMALQHATLPSSEVSVTEGSDPVDVTDLGESISYEESLARAGYTTGDLGGLESQGWTPPVVKRDADGDPIAYDPTH